MKDEKKITRNISKELFEKVVATKSDALEIANRENMIEVVDQSATFAIVDEVLGSKSELYEQYKVEPDKITNFIVGQVMKQTRGKADASAVKEYISKKMQNC